MKGLALSLAALLLMSCDIPALSGPVSDPYKIYNEYRDSLYVLQEDIAQIYLELQGKNPQAVYEHILQSIEKTAAVIGKAELASHNIHDGLQFSLQSHLELLLRCGLSEKQKTDLIDLGYAEDDMNRLLNSLVHYNDHYHHAVTGFTAEEMERFYSIGLSDEQIAELQTHIEYHYTQVHRFQKVVKHHQEELMYIQVALSLVALQTLLELDHKEKEKSKSELQKAEEKLLEAILNVSEDQSSLEHVKTFSKQVYKAAEQKIRKGEEQYFLDFFVGLQVHCGAFTALNGDPEFGLAEIFLYESVLSECVTSSERSVLPSAQIGEQPPSQIDTVPAATLIEQVEELRGQIEESDETNNVGWVVVIIKTPEDPVWEFVMMVFAEIFEHKILPDTLKAILVEFLVQIGVEEGVAIFMGHVGGVIFSIIINAPQVGGGWIDHFEDDPTRTFDEIIIDEKTVADIELVAHSSGPLCISNGYWQIIEYGNLHQIAEIVWQAERLYQSPWGFYYYYTGSYSGGEWVVVVEDRKYGLGRVVEAYKVLCHEFDCGDESYDRIYEKWELCENFTPLWTRSQPNTMWV